MKKPDYQTLNAVITTLTPLHISSGKKLLLDYDYVINGNKTYRLDEQSFLDAQDVDDPAMMKILLSQPPGHLIKESDFTENPQFFSYILSGRPRAQGSGSQLLEQMKTSSNEPYLPGSSLKGALRTAIAWQGFVDLGLRVDRRLIDERRAKFAARPIEKVLFGEDPNHDLLRVLQVGDSEPVSQDRLILLNAKVITQRSESAPIELEAIRPETKFVVRLKFDNQLLSSWAAECQGFRLGGKKEWLQNLTKIINAHSANRIENQRIWFESRHADRLASFYRQMSDLKLESNQFVTQIGWGGGWDSKTLGSRLQSDKGFFDWLVTQPQLKFLKRDIRRTPGAPFPSSRRVIMSRQKAKDGRVVEIPAVPLGWMLVELEKENLQ
jgi:CRISPR-associated protein Csm5